jgi:hypothetical protein
VKARYALDRGISALAAPESSSRRGSREKIGPQVGRDYQAMVCRVREFVVCEVPAGARVLVVSDGDDSLTALEGREGWHFPRSVEGWHAGGHPADDDEAIAHLEELRALGATWIAFPTTSFWWLDHYALFHRYLAGRYAAVQGVDNDCLLFRLGESREPAWELEAPLSPLPQTGEPGLVSVVIACYKQAHFLGKAIESVLGQTYPAVEVVVVDDGSPDATRDVAASYAEVRYVKQQNKGPSAARNRGLAEARGAYLVFLDADDMLLPPAVAAGLQALYSHADCAFVSGHYRWVGPDGEVRTVYEPDRVDGNHYEALLRLNYIGHPGSVVYRRSVLEEVGGFDEKLRGCEDYDLYLRITRQFPVCRHYRLVADYRRHDANFSSQPELMLRVVIPLLQSQRRFVKGDPALSRALATGISRYRRLYS